MTNLLNAEHIIAKIVFTTETVMGTTSRLKCLSDFLAAERIFAKIQSSTLVLMLKGHLDGKSPNVQVATQRGYRIFVAIIWDTFQTGR